MKARIKNQMGHLSPHQSNLNITINNKHSLEKLLYILFYKIR